MVVVLAVGAHPDDIELGCGGTLARHKMNGNKVYFLVLSKGEASGDQKVREVECRRATKILGADGLIFGGLEDTKIGEGVETIHVIEGVIEKLKPDIIFTHTFKDTHQDHRNTGYATLSAGRRCRKILMYESPTTFRDFSPQVFVDIKETFDLKKKATRQFSFQSNKEWWSVGGLAASAVEGLATYRGFQAGVEAAEAFEVGRLIIDLYELTSS